MTPKSFVLQLTFRVRHDVFSRLKQIVITAGNYQYISYVLITVFFLPVMRFEPKSKEIIRSTLLNALSSISTIRLAVKPREIFFPGSGGSLVTFLIVLL